MKRYTYQGVVRAIESNLDTDVITVEFGRLGGMTTETVDITIEHEEGNEAMFRQSALIDVRIDDGDSEARSFKFPNGRCIVTSTGDAI